MTRPSNESWANVGPPMDATAAPAASADDDTAEADDASAPADEPGARPAP
jgi:hypothetical protein